jgi:hypothetical protein
MLGQEMPTNPRVSLVWSFPTLCHSRRPSQDTGGRRICLERIQFTAAVGHPSQWTRRKGRTHEQSCYLAFGVQHPVS